MKDRTIRDLTLEETQDIGENVEKIMQLYCNHGCDNGDEAIRSMIFYVIRLVRKERNSQLKQPEKQEIDVSHEVTADMADFNDVVYNRDCIIELQKAVNKLLEK